MTTTTTLLAEYTVNNGTPAEQRERVLAMTDDELQAWLDCLRMRVFGDLAFKRIPWSDMPLLIDSATTLDDVREQVRESRVGRRKEGMG